MNIQKAKEFIKSLAETDCIWHFDDCPIDCLDGVVSKSQAIEYGKMIDKIYAADLDWGQYECPIGYAMECLENAQQS